MTTQYPTARYPCGGSPTILAPIYFSSDTQVGSYIRIANLGTAAGSISASIKDNQGKSLGTWTQAIAPNTAPQFTMAAIESAAGIAPSGPFARIEITSTFSGYVQHVLWNQQGASLTNLSTCEGGVSEDSTNVTNVHTSNIAAYPSSVVITNTGPSSPFSLGVYDAATGKEVGAWQGPTVPVGGSAIVNESQLESDLGWAPSSSQSHLIVELVSGFQGTIAHIVNNISAGVITDMTIRCALRGAN